MAELHGEKIDIVDWSDDPAEFVGHALSPARVSSVTVVDARRAVLRRWSSPTTSSRWPSAGRGRTPGWRPGSPAGGSTSSRTPHQPVDATPARLSRGLGRPARCRRATSRTADRVECSVADRPSASIPVRPQSVPVWDVVCGRLRPNWCGWSPGRSRRDALTSAVAWLDPDRRLPGRGAYLHPSLNCLDLAERRRALPGPYGSRAASTSVTLRDQMQH